MNKLGFSHQAFTRLQNKVHVGGSLDVAGHGFEQHSAGGVHGEGAGGRLQP